jgi:hypothetical protein
MDLRSKEYTGIDWIYAAQEMGHSNKHSCSKHVEKYSLAE